MMDTRIAVRPSAQLLAWQDGGRMAPRRMQPEVQRSALDSGRARPDSPRSPSPPQAVQQSAATYDTSGQLSASSARLVAAASWSRSDSVALQVQTAEGDVATLRFSQSSGLSLAAGASSSDGGSAQALALAWNAQSNTDLDLRVEGDLNDTEMSAINALAAQLAPVAGDFFGDNTDAALQKASLISMAGLGEAGGSLNAFSYTLRSHEVLAATAMYERVGQAGGTPAAPPPVEPEPIGSSEQAATAATTPPPRPRDLLKQVLAMLEKLRELSGAEPSATAAPERTAATAEPPASLPLAHVDVMA